MMRGILCLVALGLLVAGCGFRPVYGKQYQSERNAIASAQLAEIEVTGDTSRLNQLFQEELRDRLNPEHVAIEKRYRLHVAINEMNIPLFVAPDGTYGRGNLQYTLSYGLTRNEDGKQVDNGQLKRVSSYAASETNAIYASYVAQDDARKRGVIELANDLAMRLGNRLDHTLERPAQ